MIKINVKDLKKTTRHIEKVLELKLSDLYSEINNQSKVSIFFAGAKFRGNDNKSWFYIVVDNEVIMNPMTFPSDIPNEDVKEIANDLLKEYIKTCDFREFEGEFECIDFEDVNTLEGCKNKKEEKCKKCLGPMYSLSNNFNAFSSKTKKKWKNIYGVNSEKELELMEERIYNLLTKYKNHPVTNKKEKKLSKKLYNYIHNKKY